MTAIFMFRRFFQIFVIKDFFKFWNGRKSVNFRPIELLFFANILILIAHWDCEENKFRFFFRVINYSYFWGAGWGTHRLVKIFINKTNQYICVGVWRGEGRSFEVRVGWKYYFFLSFRFGKLKVQEDILYQWGGGKKIIQRMLCMYVRMSMCVCVCVCV